MSGVSSKRSLSLTLHGRSEACLYGRSSVSVHFGSALGLILVRVQLNFPSHPLWNKVAPAKLSQGLWIHLTSEKYLVLVSPGSIFASTDDIRDERGWAYFRICFAAVDEPDVENMSRRFVNGVKDFWGKRNLDDIEDMGTKGLEASEGLVSLIGGC